MKDKLITGLFALGLTLVLVFIIWFEVQAWGECQDTNSFWYCLRVLYN